MTGDTFSPVFLSEYHRPACCLMNMLFSDIEQRRIANQRSFVTFNYPYTPYQPGLISAKFIVILVLIFQRWGVLATKIFRHLMLLHPFNETLHRLFRQWR
jgi:hypothetical protein